MSRRRQLGGVDADHFQASIHSANEAIAAAQKGNCKRAIGSLAFAYQYAGAAHEAIASSGGHATDRKLIGSSKARREQAQDEVYQRCVRGASRHDTTKPMFGRGGRR